MRPFSLSRILKERDGLVARLELAFALERPRRAPPPRKPRPAPPPPREEKKR